MVGAEPYDELSGVFVTHDLTYFTNAEMKVTDKPLWDITKNSDKVYVVEE